MQDYGVSISMVNPMIKTLTRTGYDIAEFCSYAQLEPQLLDDPDTRITGAELERLTLAAATWTGDDHFGLHQGKMMEFVDLGILGYVMMHCGTIADSLAAYQRYNSILASEFGLEWEVQDGVLGLRMFSRDPRGLSRHCVEDMASSLYDLLGKLSHRSVPLLGVEFTHEAPADTGPYLEVFGIMPRFSQPHNRLRLDGGVLDYSVRYADQRLLALFEGLARQSVEELEMSSALSDRMLAWLRRQLPLALPTLQETAAAFHLSTRTLQERLRKEETSFNALSMQVRKELAIDYLQRTPFAVGEIAYALHFSEPSAFQNAFKKWTGLTPGQYRATAMQP
ncbi:AraC family transcriptional regulator [Paenibacillus daejeonensis]|uniref:AraC family transcriptional regulator n=1 Tax=Paenibacillus daejeonensis TaxID=135193 RepID=UPI0003618518|nr:AraC family transcriptional regulator [Paenibacillus daejeonensis]